MNSTLADCVTFINGDRGKNYPKQVDFANGEVPFVSASDLSNNSLTNVSIYQKKITKKAYEKLRSGKVVKEDILLCLRGSLGKLGVVSDDMTAAIASSLVILRPHNQTNSKFLFQWLRSPDFQQTLASFDNGSVQGNLSVKSISKITVPNFSPSEQKAIAHILGTLDDKIELNQKMNQTLEEIAKAIFKSWFVDFDPVRAKAEGRPTGLPPEISDLFPDELVDSEIGEIPKGWSVSTFGELADIQNGYAFKSKDWSEEGTIPVVKIGNVKPMLVDTESCSRVDSETVIGLERFRLSSGDALIGMTGYVGEVGLVPKVDELPYLNQRVGKLIAQAPIDYSFMVIMARREEFKEEVERLGTGSAQANVSATSIKSIKVILPACDLKKKFGEIINPFIDRILTSAAEIGVLSELRDTLLPKLISGELRIPDAEKFLEEAGL